MRIFVPKTVAGENIVKFEMTFQQLYPLLMLKSSNLQQ